MFLQLSKLLTLQLTQLLVPVYLQLSCLLVLVVTAVLFPGTCGFDAVETSGTCVSAAVPSSPDVSDPITSQLILTNQIYLPVEDRTFISFLFL